MRHSHASTPTIAERIEGFRERLMTRPHHITILECDFDDIEHFSSDPDWADSYVTDRDEEQRIREAGHVW